MFCYHCGRSLSEHDFCTACGADVSLYKKIMQISNMYYNEGLEKANVRDLSGAVVSLRQSLKFNKSNIEARNLLGLVYFELGEAVLALREWVISKNLQPEKNVADFYIEAVQSSASRLDTLNQSIKKYNLAYYYCQQGSKDLAMIQLKKVLSMNPRLVQAHQLLALLYMDSEQWEKARKELKKCQEIDKGNTLTLRYMKEVRQMLMPDEGSKGTIRRTSEDAVRYQSDNEIIIQPLNVKETKKSGVTSVLNILLGIVIGVAAVYFLILPARVEEEKNAANIKIAEIGNQLDDKTSTIAELESQKKKLQSEKEALQQEIQGYAGEDGTLSRYAELMNAAGAYLESDDAAQAGESLEKLEESVDMDQMPEAFIQLYQTLLAQVGPKLAGDYYTAGKRAYDAGNYADAIPNLSKAFYYDNTNGEALYRLAQSYRHTDDTENAINTYKQVVELFPGTENADVSQGYIDQLSAE